MESLNSQSEESPGRSELLRRLQLIVPLVALVVTLLVGSAFALVNFGVEGLLVCLAVWLVIAVASAVSHFAGRFFSTPDLAQAQIMIGMMVRTGVPLFFALLITQVARHWVDLGFVYYLFAFYFVGLAVDVFLMAAESPFSGQSSSVSDRSLVADRR